MSLLKEQEVADDNFVALRELLLGDQIREVEALRRRLDDPIVRSQETSRILADALSISVHRDQKTRSALHPIVEESLRASVEKNPALLASVLFPIVGQAVRKAVAHSLQHMFDSLNSTLDGKLFFKRLHWRIEAMRSGKSFGEIALIRSLAYRVEHVYLIHRKTGLLLAEKGREPSLLGDADLVVGMLTALQDFVRDSFTAESQDDLEVMQVGDFKVWLQHGPLTLLAVVVRGQLPPELRRIFAKTVEEVHQKFHSQLVSFEASGQPIPGVGDGLDACLLGEAPTRKPSYIKNKVAAGIIFAAILGGLAIHVRDGVRWKKYLDTLRREPGIVVIDAHRNWSTFSITGLRDPMARDPRLLLSGFHLSGKQITEHWEGYLSLDSNFANKRRLDAEVDAIRKTVVRFDLNSSVIPLEQLPLVDTLGEQINQLAFDTALQNKALRVKIFGHTDHTGTEDRNAKLSQERAETMVRMLISHGVAPDILSAAGLGDKQPHLVTADLYEQNLDRRVTFALFLDDKK
jgi:outer membrane protein OmpA-like peptidoglycan-associated protein